MKFVQGEGSIANCVVHQDSVIAVCRNAAWEKQCEYARLMAAAPELLSALQEMVQWQMDSMSGKSTKGYPGTKAMAAINKATGN